MSADLRRATRNEPQRAYWTGGGLQVVDPGAAPIRLTGTQSGWALSVLLHALLIGALIWRPAERQHEDGKSEDPAAASELTARREAEARRQVSMIFIPAPRPSEKDGPPPAGPIAPPANPPVAPPPAARAEGEASRGVASAAPATATDEGATPAKGSDSEPPSATSLAVTAGAGPSLAYHPTPIDPRLGIGPQGGLSALTASNESPRCLEGDKKPRDPNAPPVLGTVIGRVLEQNGTHPLAGAHLQILGTSYHTFTDAAGEYVLQFDIGLVERCRVQLVRVSAPGYATRDLYLGVGPNTRSDDVVLPKY